MTWDGVKCQYPHLLTDAEIDYVNTNYHILVNHGDDRSWYSKVMNAIEQLAINNNDWWDQGNVIVFTNENDKAMVYLTIR